MVKLPSKSLKLFVCLSPRQALGCNMNFMANVFLLDRDPQADEMYQLSSVGYTAIKRLHDEPNGLDTSLRLRHLLSKSLRDGRLQGGSDLRHDR